MVTGSVATQSLHAVTCKAPAYFPAWDRVFHSTGDPVSGRVHSDDYVARESLQRSA